VIADEKILITGVSGTIGAALAHHLAPTTRCGASPASPGRDTRDKEAYTAVATPPPSRALSIRRRSKPRASPCAPSISRVATSARCPSDFTYVVHLAWMRADLAQLEDALRANVEGAGLVLQHCRTRRPRW
jgi:nucleoside-diphosphate-sugar epimerase